MADCDGLENRCACKRTVGSNPTLSAILSPKALILPAYFDFGVIYPHSYPHCKLRKLSTVGSQGTCGVGGAIANLVAVISTRPLM